MRFYEVNYKYSIDGRPHHEQLFFTNFEEALACICDMYSPTSENYEKDFRIQERYTATYNYQTILNKKGKKKERGPL